MNNVCHNIGNMEFMKTVPDKFYDLAIVDPPYGIGDFTRSTTHGKKIQRSFSKPRWNNKIPDEIYFRELLRISKNQIIWGANYYNCFKSGGAIVWFKNMGHPDYSQCEIASNSLKRTVDYIRIDWNVCRLHIESIIHPCQKPIALYKWLLSKYAKPGWTIFDSHVGSGSIRIACHDMGFDFTGCELDLDYFNAQEERFKNHVAQAELFENQEIQASTYEQAEELF